MERKDDFTKTEEEMVSKLNKMADELIEKIKSNVAGKVCEKIIKSLYHSHLLFPLNFLQLYLFAVLQNIVHLHAVIFSCLQI